MTEPRPRIIDLRSIGQASVGGKAEGLARLLTLGLKVPEGFVITGARPGVLPANLEKAYEGLGGGMVAVRSSAADEDGAEASFAGQYESHLNVEGLEALRLAVESCLSSADSARARAYRRQQAGQGNGNSDMAVVVQRMVDARAAGVLFTADPVEARRDRVVIDAVTGLGEALVSGQASPDHFLLDRQGRILKRELEGKAPVLSDAELSRLWQDAHRVEDGQGQALDLEWAIDKEGELFWLQARPITTPLADPTEFDSPARPGHVLTTANTGEMMPGAVSPLTISTTVLGIDQGIQRMFVAMGALPEVRSELITIGMYYNHIFFDLSALAVSTQTVAGSTVEQLSLSIVGRMVPELKVGPKAPRWRRIYNGMRYMHYVLSAPKRIREWEKRIERFRIPRKKRAHAMALWLDEHLEMLIHSYEVHLQSSAASGVTSSVLLAWLAGGKQIQAEQEAELAGLLAGAGGVESAGLLHDLDWVCARIAEQAEHMRDFVAVPAPQALTWLRSEASGMAGRAFAYFIKRHGHRSLRELDMQQPGWADEPEPLVRSFQAQLRVGTAESRTTGEQGSGRKIGRAMGRVLRWSQAAVRQREYTKGLLVEVTHRFKRAYRHLADLLVWEGKLPDAELAFFLTHEELLRLAGNDGPEEPLLELARARQVIFDGFRGLAFPDISIGKPEPLPPPDAADLAEDELSGKPVSRGVVEGPARVAFTLADADAIQAGEILVAPITDVGWTPYFRIIAGLATDVGSAISHGAVVAREYGLPAVVNLRKATRVVRTGDYIRLDANHGLLTILRRASTDA
ncbi:MAG: pyruvate, water dikinase [Deltaproteobacteria bacterium]|nr:pyruvate, water dikinase [Deltaproteobacteria bacterium]